MTQRKLQPNQYDLATTAVTPASYTNTNITVDAYGRITSAANGTAGTVTSVDGSGGTTGLTLTGGAITGSGTLTLGGTLGIANGGTGQTTAPLAINALLPSQTGNDGFVLTTNGTDVSWIDLPNALNVFAYRADTGSNVGTGIGTGRIRWNNATQASATSLFINNITGGGYDIGALFAVVAAGAKFYFQVTDDPAKFQTWTVVTATDNTTYYTFTVTLDESAGGNFANNRNMSVGLVRTGGGSGTVTSVAALTLGTTGTDLSSTVANSTTTPVITLNVPTASATNRGALSAADWTTFNNKGSGTVTSVSGTAPVSSSGGATPAISMAAANGTTDGYLTSANWTTFNNKGSGTVTSVSVASSNGFAGSSSGGATPALTLSTSVTGVLYGNGTSIAASNVTNDAQVKLSTVTTAGDLILATGNAAVTRLAIGTTGQSLNVVGGTAAWSSPYPIGAILQSPTAPAVGGTWLECDGTGVSQATYATLFGVIGHSWCSYTATTTTTDPGVTFARIIWSGTRWLGFVAASTTVYGSTDGLTWASVGTLPGALTGVFAMQGASGEVVVYSTLATTVLYRTVDNGVNWTTPTAFPASLIYYLAYNGTHWLAVPTTTTNCYSSTNLTGAWTTNAGVLTATGAASVVWSTTGGGGWAIIGGSTIQKTSVSSGVSGWSSVTASSNGFINSTFPSSGRCSTDPTLGIIWGSTTYWVNTTDNFTTTSTQPAGWVANSGPFHFWNGFVTTTFMGQATQSNSYVIDGTKKVNTVPIFNNVYSGSVVLPGNPMFGPSTLATLVCDTATGRYVSFRSAPRTTFLYTPNATLTTQFCLPSFLGSTKNWIRAL